MTSTVTPQPLPESCRNPTSTSSPPLLFASLRTLASWYYSIFPAHLSFLEKYITYFNYLAQNNTVKIHLNYNRSNIACVMFPIYWIRNNSNTCSNALEHWTEPLYCWLALTLVISIWHGMLLCFIILIDLYLFWKLWRLRRHRCWRTS